MRKELPEVDAFWGVDSEDAIAAHIGTPENKEIKTGPALPSTFPYAYLKIAEGCKRRCSFCSIPAIRGPLRSFAPDALLRQAEDYIRAGTKELILVSQDTTSYNVKGYGLASLLRDLAAIGGDFRIRVHYFYPAGVDERLLDAMASVDKVAKYVDMPLQHSEERILRLMARGGGAAGEKLAGRIRRAIPGVAIRTAFIVGFPGETEDEFRRLLDFVEEQQFERMGAFIYSKEDGTAAARLRGHLPREIKQRRYDELMTAQSVISLEKNKALVGRTFRVLIDETEGDAATGRLPSQSPGIDGVITVGNRKGKSRGNKKPKKIAAGDFVLVRVTGASEYDLEGVPA